MNTHESDILTFNNKTIYEIRETTTLMNALLLSCQDKEFKGQYYNLPQNLIYKLSEERNGYMTLINLALEKLYNIQKYQLNLEHSISSSHKNSYYCSR